MQKKLKQGKEAHEKMKETVVAPLKKASKSTDNYLGYYRKLREPLLSLQKKLGAEKFTKFDTILRSLPKEVLEKINDHPEIIDAFADRILHDPEYLAKVKNGNVLEVENVKYWNRITANSLKEFKSLVKQLSRPDSELTLNELRRLEKLVKRFGGTLRYDLNPIKGRFIKPHVQIEGLGQSIQSRHIWLADGVR